MSDKTKLLALFPDIDPASAAIDKLRQMGIGDKEIDVISGIPFHENMLGRPKIATFIPRLALAGAIAGLLVAVFLIFGTPTLFPLHTGGQPLLPYPPLIIVGFEMTMLGLMGIAFLGVFLASHFPAYEPVDYDTEISDGKIAIVFQCPGDQQTRFEDALVDLKAESVRSVEAKTL
jgi:Alternative complex III, ActD subunit